MTEKNELLVCTCYCTTCKEGKCDTCDTCDTNECKKCDGERTCSCEA